jgi:hypothetical protein
MDGGDGLSPSARRPVPQRYPGAADAEALDGTAGRDVLQKMFVGGMLGAAGGVLFALRRTRPLP